MSLGSGLDAWWQCREQQVEVVGDDDLTSGLGAIQDRRAVASNGSTRGVAMPLARSVLTRLILWHLAPPRSLQIIESGKSNGREGRPRGRVPSRPLGRHSRASYGTAFRV